ncbi:hypothetical protein NKR19_g9023 [Coniochaeta hoffmannii]|uniref:Uncharacterized protein n=1 Tax=Coniochaeta hoffmannii TaxID=91930 RepID=A0AA38RDU6_9PEZI|nr:hypothetical protein NKR19_g9023 [Coniochaeta hoffmannii]
MPKPNYSGSGYSGEDRRVYEAGDQRTVSNKELDEMNRTHGGNIAEAQTRPSDRQTKLANKIIEQDRVESGKFTQKSISQEDPTAPAIMHGNEPSRGAKIDKELQEEDQAILARKGDAMPGKKY